MLANRAAHGFVWGLTQAIAAKLVALVAQIVLARILIPKEFGVFGLAMILSAFAGLIQDAGITQVLVQRHDRFAEWATPAFYLSITTGSIAALLMIVAAPLMARVYGHPEIVGLIAVLAIATLLNGCAVVPNARLQGQLRFRALSLIGLAVACATAVLSILLARLGFGAYSLAVPVSAAAAVRAILLWAAARPRLGIRLRLSAWRGLAGDSALLFATSLCIMLTSQGDYIVLGRLRSAEVLGVYYFAFGLSIQTAQLLSNTLASVMFPSLTQLREDVPRQTQGFLRAARTFGIISIPACLLQGAVAGPLVRLLFGTKWAAAIPLLEILSVGVAFSSVAFGGSLMLARRLNRLYLVVAIASSLLFFSLVIPASYFFSSVGTATAVSAHLVIMTIVGLYVVLRMGGAGMREVFEVLAPPVATSVAAALTAVASALAVPKVYGEDWIRLALIIFVFGVVYLPLSYLVARDSWIQLFIRVHALWSRRMQEGGTPPLSSRPTPAL